MRKKILFIGTSLFYFLKIASAQHWQMKSLTIPTRWSKEVNSQNALPEYPRPQLVRSNWQNLNGVWNYSITPKDASEPEKFNGQILVPYPIESALSGVKKALKPEELLWYSRTFITTPLRNNEHLLLHFGAIDYEATVLVNGKEVAHHTGGYQSFSCDITKAIRPGANELKVKVWDPTDQGTNPHGKQVLNPGGIMYTASSGIWQTVWLEKVAASYVEQLKIKPDLENHTVLITPKIINSEKGDIIEVAAISKGKTIQRSTGMADQQQSLGIANVHPWSPDDPFLYDLSVRILRNGKVIDQVNSYFGMRKVEIKKDEKGIDRIFLNNKFYYNLGTLDQGFWPDGLYTAPTDAALKFDIQAIKAMGFNTIRKHIKVEPARWYYWTDKLGMLVWQDMVNPPNDKEGNRAPFEKETKEIIDQLYNSPSIVTWVLFNEGWGAYDQARLTQWMKSYDSSRIINGHTGENYYQASPSEIPKKWPLSDLTDIHAYPPPKMPYHLDSKGQVIGEFGGIAVSVEGHLWNPLNVGFGYGNLVSPSQMKLNYNVMTDTLIKFKNAGLSGSIYTQPYDVEGEQNGFLTYDRQVTKLSIKDIRQINAKVWPTTANWKESDTKFSALLMDPSIPSYATRLAQYNAGVRDSLSLFRLANYAWAEKKTDVAFKIANEYIQKLKNPLSEYNLKFILKFTNGSRQPGFSIIMKNIDLARKSIDPTQLNFKLQEIIFREEVRPLLDSIGINWDSVDAILRKYPRFDGEPVIGSMIIYYLNAAVSEKPKALENLVEAATRYDDIYHGGAYNDWAWMLFTRSNDKELLHKGLGWAKKEVDRKNSDDDTYPNVVDTYANLLYKLEYKEEAIKWEEKAFAKASSDPAIKLNLEKMKKGQPTWK